MKTTKFFFLTAAAIALAACSSSSPNGNGMGDNDDNDKQENPTVVAATFSANIKAVSRAAGTSWDANDEIGITAADNSDMAAKYKNVKFTTTGDGNFSGGPVYYQNEASVTFNAYYPYSSTGGTIKSSTTADKQTTTGQKQIDYLFATATGASKTKPSVNFTFTHQMSQLAITFQQGDDVDLKDLTAYTVSGLCLDGTFNTETGAAAASGSAADLTMSVTGESVKTVAAPAVILYPQTATSFDLTVTLGGQTFSQQGIAIKDNALKAGNCYNYTITISKTGLEVKQTSISDWNSVDAGSGTVVF